MTQDFINDFSEALEKEGRPYLIAVHSHPRDPRGVHIRTELEGWPQPTNGKTKEQDVLEAIAAAFQADGLYFEITLKK